MESSKESIHTFTPQQLRQLQLKSLEMFLYFKDICEKNNLLFYFCGGCCIGAIRHQGFIPWDDDIDVFMPREDYIKLGEIWNQQADTSRYTYYVPGPDFNDRNMFATIRDAQTTFIKPYQADLDINQGLMLDIMPLDGCPSGKWQRKFQKMWAMVYSLFCTQMVPEKHGGLITWGSKILLKIVSSAKTRYKIWHFAEKKMTQYPISQCEYITELCAGPGYMQNEYPKAAFEEAVYKEFEGHMVPLPKGYDAYLKMAFGDYMSLPPKENQVAHHDVVLCDLENSYVKYKGKYYCVEKEQKDGKAEN